MAIGVGDLKEPLAKATELMPKRRDQRVIGGHRIGAEVGNLCESWISAGRDRRACSAFLARESTETKGIPVWILRQLSNFMMAEVNDAPPNFTAKPPPQFEVPPLVPPRAHFLFPVHIPM